MGYYLNPQFVTKERWLTEHGTVTRPELPKDPDAALVCLIENRDFSAAAVIYDKDELEAFVNDGTSRPRRWYLVDKELIFNEVPTVRRRYEEAK